MSDKQVSLSGDGTVENLYCIECISDFDEIRYDLDACYKFTDDIDVSGTNSWNRGYGFEQIDSVFTGVLNGGGIPYEDYI